MSRDAKYVFETMDVQHSFHKLRAQNTARIALTATMSALALACVVIAVVVLLRTKPATLMDPKDVGAHSEIVQVRVLQSKSDPSKEGLCVRVKPSQGTARAELVPCDAFQRDQQFSFGTIQQTGGGKSGFQMFSAHGARQPGATGVWRLVGACAQSMFGDSCVSGKPCPWTFSNNNEFHKFSPCGSAAASDSCARAPGVSTPDALFEFLDTSKSNRLGFVVSDHNPGALPGSTGVGIANGELVWQKDTDVVLGFVNAGNPK